MATINLPTKKKKASLKTPQRMILFSKPKVGKSIAVAQLDDCLMLDFERGTLAIDAMAVQIKKYSDVDDVIEAIKKAKYPYKYIAIDTASALEEMCLSQAEMNYANSPDGKDWFLKKEDGTLHPKSGKAKYGSIMHLGFGKGYTLVGEAFTAVVNKLERCAPKMIILAHSTNATVKENGDETSVLDIMLGKKARFSSTFKADAIGYIYRKGSKNYVNFTATGDVGAGGRHRYLEKEHILLSEYDEDDNLITHWDDIFLPETKAKTTTEKS